MNKKMLATINFLLAFTITTMIPAVTFAGGAGLPLESTLSTVLASLDGPVAYFIAVGSIIASAAAWAASEGGSMTKNGFRLVVALSGVLNAVTWVSVLWNKSSGLGM